MKKCSQCEILKEFSEFNNRTSSKDGKESYCKICNRTTCKIWRDKNKEKKRLIDKKYRENNKEKLTLYFREHIRKKRQSNVLERLKNNLRRRIHKALKGQAKSRRTVELLGLSVESVMLHIESLFQIGMTWDNYGQWHIDHIIPLASAKTQEELEKLFHYTNLQPLWAIDNIKKSDTMPQHNL